MVWGFYRIRENIWGVGRNVKNKTTLNANNSPSLGEKLGLRIKA